MTLNLIGGLAVFLYGMKVMSEALQKLAGSRLRNLLNRVTQNRFMAVLVGFVITCAVQSSSATTVMVVSFASAGLLSLYQSLGVIFGANIGTTTTGWLVGLLGFKVKITKFALPLIGIGFFSQFIKRWRWPHRIGEVLVGFGFLFFGLALIKQAIPDLQDSPFVMNLVSSFHPDHIGSRLMIVLVGTVLTMIFQSSSAMMVVTLAAAASGLINFEGACALVLGENIGTTLTANLASIGAPLTAKRAARGHFIFNVFGVTWAILFFLPFIRLVDFLVPGNPFGKTEASLLVAIPIHIAAFHTIFNVLNTAIALFTIRPLERVIVWLVPDKDVKDKFDLLYLSTPFSNTPELAVTAAQKEVDRMADLVVKMLETIQTLVGGNGTDKKFDEKIEAVLKDEKMTDLLEHKINEYLSKLTHDHLSSSSNKKVLSLLSMINDLERIGDHGEKLVTLLSRSKEKNLKFSPEGLSDLSRMVDQTLKSIRPMKDVILTRNGDPMPGGDRARGETESIKI